MPLISAAQTNGQLFVQILRGGTATPEELRLLRDAYLFAMQLYGGLYTGSGKTSIAHEVGTASLVHRHGGSMELVVAGLLHGIYAIGDFGHLSDRIDDGKRAEVRAVVGLRVEEVVYRLWRDTYEWRPPQIAALCERVPSMDECERGVFLVKLAEELDRMLDFGAILWSRRAERVKEHLRLRRDPWALLAERLGHPALAGELREAVDVTLAAELPPEFMGVEWPGNAHPLGVPRSYRRKLPIWLYRNVASQVARARRVLRRTLAR